MALKIDFRSQELEVLLNPRIGEIPRAFIQKLVNGKLNEKLKKHVLVASSGTTKKEDASFKLIALSKDAILTSAKSVNAHLNVTKKDVWLNSLPLFHVGGIGIEARAFLADSKVVQLQKWEPRLFCELMESEFVTLSSLVPAQLYDLCQKDLKPPKTLRGVIIGGGALNENLYIKAKRLEWPLFLSYGLTECASQVATSDNKTRDLNLLSHVQARVNDKGNLEIKSEALLTYEVHISENQVLLHDPKKDGWLVTEDIVSLKKQHLVVFGRSQDFIKIGGEGVILSSLEQKLDSMRFLLDIADDAAIVAYPDKRLGFVIHLATTSPNSGKLVTAFNDSCMPYERIRFVHHVNHIPRSPLKKLLRHDLNALILNSPTPN